MALGRADQARISVMTGLEIDAGDHELLRLQRQLSS